MHAWYGSILGVAKDKQAPPPAWESRAAIWNLVLNTASLAGSTAPFIATLYLYIKSGAYRFGDCSEGSKTGLSHAGTYFCVYTGSYVRVFPEVALVVALLLIGRNYLQERLYYGLLRSGGVLQFQSTSMWKDPLVVFFLWCWLNCVLHMGVIMVTVYLLGGGADITQAIRKSVLDEVGGKSPVGVSFAQRDLNAQDYLAAEMKVLLELVGFFLCPSVLFIVYLFGAYDIEAKLLPLSIYFRDARDLESSWTPRAMAELVVLDDSVAKALIDEHQGKILDKITSRDAEYAEVLRLYCEDGERYTRQEFQAIGLLESLWPSQLLLAPHIKDSSARTFRVFWSLFMLVACLGLLVILFSISAWIVFDVQGIIAGDWQYALSAVVYMGHILVVGMALMAICRTSTSYFSPRELA